MRVIPGTGSRHGREGANGWITDFVRKDFPRQAENLILAEIEDKEGQEQIRVSVNESVVGRLRSRPGSRECAKSKHRKRQPTTHRTSTARKRSKSRTPRGRLCGSSARGSHSARSTSLCKMIECGFFCEPAAPIAISRGSDGT